MKKLWLIMLAVALAFGLVFGIAGCRDLPELGPEAKGDLVIEDADEIGALVQAVHLFNDKVGADVGGAVSTDKNVLHMKMAADDMDKGPAFKISFPQEAIDTQYYSMVIDFELSELTKITTGEFVKIGFKQAAYPADKVDMTPYADHEIWFGTPEAGSKVGDTGSVSIALPNKAPHKAVWFDHNKYKGDTGIFAGKKGSDGPVDYKLTITKIVFKGADSITYKPVTGVDNVQKKWIPGFDLTLPELASPSDATMNKITWSVVAAGGTGTLTADGNTIKGITSTGTLKVLATVKDGKAEGEDFTKEFEITIVNAVNLGISIGSSDINITSSWNESNKISFSAIDTAGFIYEAITIRYTSDKETRVSLANSGSRLSTTLAGDGAGSSSAFEGWDDLKASATATQVTIPITDVGQFNQIIIGSKGATEVPVTINILGIFIEKKQVCEFCQGELDAAYDLAHKATCFKPVTSIGDKVSTGSFINLDLPLPTQAFPSYATNRDITWSGQGVIYKSGQYYFQLGWADTVTIKATVKNGSTATTDFVDTFAVNVTPALDIVIPGSSITKVDFGYGHTYKSPGVITINDGYQRAGFNIGATVYNAVYKQAVLVIVAPEDGRISMFVNGTGGDDGAGWDNITSDGANEVTVTVDLTATKYNGLAINQFAIENTGSAAADFTIKSITFVAK